MCGGGKRKGETQQTKCCGLACSGICEWEKGVQGVAKSRFLVVVDGMNELGGSWVVCPSAKIDKQIVSPPDVPRANAVSRRIRPGRPAAYRARLQHPGQRCCRQLPCSPPRILLGRGTWGLSALFAPFNPTDDRPRQSTNGHDDASDRFPGLLMVHDSGVLVVLHCCSKFV